MTIRDLLSHLAQYPPDTRVVVGGYEGGYNDITILENHPVYNPMRRPNGTWSARRGRTRRTGAVASRGEQAVGGIFAKRERR